MANNIKIFGSELSTVPNNEGAKIFGSSSYESQNKFFSPGKAASSAMHNTILREMSFMCGVLAKALSEKTGEDILVGDTAEDFLNNFNRVSELLKNHLKKDYGDSIEVGTDGQTEPSSSLAVGGTFFRKNKSGSYSYVLKQQDKNLDIPLNADTLGGKSASSILDSIVPASADKLGTIKVWVDSEGYLNFSNTK